MKEKIKTVSEELEDFVEVLECPYPCPFRYRNQDISKFLPGIAIRRYRQDGRRAYGYGSELTGHSWWQWRLNLMWRKSEWAAVFGWSLEYEWDRFLWVGKKYKFSFSRSLILFYIISNYILDGICRRLARFSGNPPDQT